MQVPVSLTGLRDIDIIATLGPKTFTESVLSKLVHSGASIFRINGSHESVDQIEIHAKKIRKAAGSKVRILVDLPGNKVRTTGLSKPIPLSIGKAIELYRHQVNYEGFFRVLTEGEELLASDGLIRFEIEGVSDEKIILRCKTNGELGNHKGLHTGAVHNLPFLFEKDYAILEKAKRADIDYVGVSFVRQREDVEVVRNIVAGSPLQMLVKVETRDAVENLDAILPVVEQILIDRGDLCADIGYVHVPFTQAMVMRKARAKGVKVALATQFLHSMVTRDVPLIAEVEAIYHAVKSGASAIQVSEETSVGDYPDEVVKVVANMIQQALREESGLNMVMSR